MSAKRKSSVRISSKRDEAPEIDEKWIVEADLFRGAKLVRRGRPRLENPRVLLSLRLPQDVIESWKASGPGWQTRMAEVLEKKRPRPASSAR